MTPGITQDEDPQAETESEPATAAAETESEPAAEPVESKTCYDLVDGFVYVEPVVPVAYANAFRAMEIPHVSATFVNNGKEPANLRFAIDLKGYTTGPSTELVRVDPGEESEVALDLNFDVEKISQLAGKTRVSVETTVTCTIGDKTETVYEKGEPVELLGPNEAVLGTYDENDEWIDWSHMLPVFVTPESQAVKELLRVAADFHVDGSMSGYQCGDCDEDEWQEYTAQQVEAIFDALADEYEVTYVNMPASFGSRSHDVITQRVNLPEDSLEVASANCLDGTILFASALEAIGIKAYIVAVPGHAYLAWDTAPDEDLTRLDALETTMLSSSLFSEANLAGQETMDEDWDALFDEENLDYWLVDIDEARRSGIEPLAG